MSEDTFLESPGRGRISEGPRVSLIESTLQFVSSELASWRDDPDRKREEAEDFLNAQLCKYLNAVALKRFPMVLFSHEERQTGDRRVDISAGPSTGTFIGQLYHSIYEPFLVFEGKRLPAPSTSREREYVTGGAQKSGGIQRFKLALHGAAQTTAAMIGYVQMDSLAEWLSRINTWIGAEAKGEQRPGEKWCLDERLVDFHEDLVHRVGVSNSVHTRSAPVASPQIRIRHIWVTMF